MMVLDYLELTWPKASKASTNGLPRVGAGFLTGLSPEIPGINGRCFNAAASDVVAFETFPILHNFSTDRFFNRCSFFCLSRCYCLVAATTRSHLSKVNVSPSRAELNFDFASDFVLIRQQFHRIMCLTSTVVNAMLLMKRMR